MKNKKKAFTLIEMLISMGLMAAILVTLSTMVHTSRKVIDTTRTYKTMETDVSVTMAYLSMDLENGKVAQGKVFSVPSDAVSKVLTNTIELYVLNSTEPYLNGQLNWTDQPPASEGRLVVVRYCLKDVPNNKGFKSLYRQMYKVSLDASDFSSAVPYKEKLLCQDIDTRSYSAGESIFEYSPANLLNVKLRIYGKETRTYQVKRHRFNIETLFFIKNN